MGYPLLEAHGRACTALQTVADRVQDDQWDSPTPCTEWDARALVEHVIGFHEFLVIRPLGARARRQKDGSPADRWRATQDTLLAALGEPGALDRDLDLPGGGTTRLRGLVPSLTNDVIAHTWDLARATGLDAEIDPDLVSRAYAIASSDASFGAGDDMFDPAVPVADDADDLTKLVALYGRDPAWAPPG